MVLDVQDVSGETVSQGYWLPHSSSVNFCEPDYISTDYVVEPFNTVSSLFISLLGIIGILYSNPTKEWMFFTSYVLIVAIGLGSVALHATLHWFPQSLDELPMLWCNIAALFILIRMKSTPSRRLESLSVLLSIFAIGVTYIYYSMRSLYGFFIFGYVLTVAAVAVWTMFYVFERSDDVLIRQVFLSGIGSFILIGASCWVIDMNMCDHLLPLYHAANGFTLHVIWHIAAGYGGYLHVQTLILARMRVLNKKVNLHWVLGCVPVIRERLTKIDSQQELV
mmetsp:Transcript_16815/g.25276  ORF Transcript_16815/g.25276 Transcript_16815/m.25276 type:complete len:279 (+) Transcript_16815:122-958(+)